MARRDPRVTRYIKSAKPFARPILTRLRTAIHRGAPRLEESIKWGMPAFLHRGKIVCGIAGFKAHCALWFWNSRAVVGTSAKAGMGQFGRITSVEDLPSATKIRSYVAKGIELIEQRSAKG